MKFEFEVVENGKSRRGTMDAADREQALATLETGGFRVEKLQAVGASRRWAPWSFVALSLCVLGLLAACWSAVLGLRTEVPSEDRQTMVLEVRGALRGGLERVGKVSVVFPQLPARIEGNWAEVGQPDGSFLLRRELTTFESSPLYFHLKVLDTEGKVLARSEQNRFDPGTGKGAVAPLTLSTK